MLRLHCTYWCKKSGNRDQRFEGVPAFTNSCCQTQVWASKSFCVWKYICHWFCQRIYFLIASHYETNILRLQNLHFTVWELYCGLPVTMIKLWEGRVKFWFWVTLSILKPGQSRTQDSIHDAKNLTYLSTTFCQHSQVMFIGMWLHPTSVEFGWITDGCKWGLGREYLHFYI